LQKAALSKILKTSIQDFILVSVLPYINSSEMRERIRQVLSAEYIYYNSGL